MASVSPDFPEPFSEVLARLQGALELLRECVALSLAGGPSLADVDNAAASNTGASPESATFAAFDAIEAPLRDCGQALRASGRVPLALVVEACAASVITLLSSHPRHTPEGYRLVEQALEAVLQQAAKPGGDDLALVAELFPAYQAVVQLSGVDRAHPADLWPGRHPLLDLPSDPFAAPRRLDAEARLALEEALLNTLRQPSPQAFRAMSDLCTALGEGSAAPQSDLWKLAGAAYEAQADELLAPDVYLKRMGARLLSLTRTGQDAGPQVQASARQIGHELLFRCHSALAAAGVPAAPAVGPRLERVAAACGVPLLRPSQAGPAPVEPPQPLETPSAGTAGGPDPAADETETEVEAPVPDLVLPSEPVPEAPARNRAPRSLAEAVPGLPSSADLDLSGWGLAANADRVVKPDDEIKVIGNLRLEIPVFNAFLNDADEASRRLSMLLAEWAVAPVLPLPAEAAVQAFALAQGADRVGHEALAALAHQLVRVLRACAAEPGPAAVVADPAWAAQHLTAAADEMRRVLHQFAAGFLTEPSAACVQHLAECLADPLPSAATGHRAARACAQPPSDEGELQSLHDLASLQTELASALDRLAQVRPSQAAAASDLAVADQHFDRAWSEATDRLAAAEGLIRSLLDRPRDPER
jgi:hypothetical protein